MADASGYVGPAASGGSFERYDQGIDWKGPVGSAVVSIGPGHLDRISYNAGGFGIASYYHLTGGPGKGKEIYVGHADPIWTDFKHDFPAGTPISRLLQTPHGNAPGDPGHTEVGIASPGGAGPAYPLDGSDAGGIAFAELLASWGIPNISGVNPYGSSDVATGKTQPPPATVPPSSTPSNCAGDNFSLGACSNPGVGNVPKDATGYPCCAQGYGTSGDVTGACNDANCTLCCGAGIGTQPGGNQTPSSGSGSCQCAHVHIPLLGGFNLLPCFICDFFDALTSEAFWVRAGEVILGVILVVVGLRMFVSGNLLPKGATAATAAVVA